MASSEYVATKADLMPGQSFGRIKKEIDLGVTNGGLLDIAVLHIRNE